MASVVICGYTVVDVVVVVLQLWRMPKYRAQPALRDFNCILYWLVATWVTIQRGFVVMLPYTLTL